MAPSPVRKNKHSSRLSLGDSRGATAIAKQQQHVWVPTDLVEAVLKSGNLGANWKPSKRNRSSSEAATDWGWCRAVVVSSAVTHAAVATPTDENSNTQTSPPFESFALPKCVISPPVVFITNKQKSRLQLKRRRAPATTSLPLEGSPEPPISKTFSITVTVNDKEFAPDHLQGATVSFTYNTRTGTDTERVCCANDWWVSGGEDQKAPTNLQALEQLHEPAVVYCLLRRYQENHIYTYSGKILLALNPFSPLPDLYGEDVMQGYWQQTDPTSIESSRSKNQPPPHIYAIAEDAYRSVIRSLKSTPEGENQSVLVSGESGAGKTVTTKIILQYLAVLSQKSNTSTDVVGIESQVLESNPILESFGNARTVRNDNSSRFGKYMEMQFETTGCLVSASIETYLLEKVRLISQVQGERNYHVFYEVLAGLSPSERRELHMLGRSVQDFRMTSVSGTFDRRDRVDDRTTFVELRRALATVGFTRKEQLDLFSLTCALLYTSNLTFVENSSDESSLDTTNPSLRFAVALLGVDFEFLNVAVCSCAIEARGETLYKNLSINRAEKAVEALIKTIYGALFAHIVRKINSFTTIRQDHVATSENGHKKASTASIGVLDIFGFESFDRNSFEQLCINYCNEALQQQFNHFVFKLEQQEYQKEGIDCSFIDFPDNQDVLDLIEKRHDGILSVLDEQSRLPRCTDATFARAVYLKCSIHPKFEATNAMQAQLSFGIQHYAGFVKYDAECFLEKNKDELPKEAMELLKWSSVPFVAMLGRELTEVSASIDQQSAASLTMAQSATHLPRASSSLRRDSVGTQFCSQLKVLCTRIEFTAPHYVRCLKPNDELVPHSFNALVVADQLSCAGVIEAIRVSRVGFPNQFHHDHFVQRYGILERTAVAHHKRKQMNGKMLCCILVDLLNPKLTLVLDPASDDDQQGTGRPQKGREFLGIQIGKTKVFIRKRAFEALEHIRAKKQEDAMVRIQSVVRMFLRRINYEIARNLVTPIQKLVRQIGASHIVRELRIEHSAAMIQMAFRCFKAKRILHSARWIACWCQSAYRGAIARQYCAYVFLDKKALSIQHVWRKYRSKIRRAVVRVQTRHRRLRDEARDLSAEAAERYKFKEDSNQLRKELEPAKQSPEILPKPLPSLGRSAELAKLRSKVQNLQFELEKAHRMSSPSKIVDERAEALINELASREEELARMRQEVAGLRMRNDHSSMKSLAIESSSIRDWSGHGSISAPSPRHRACPVRSDVRLIDDQIANDVHSEAARGQERDVNGDEFRHLLHMAIREKSMRHLDQVLQQTSERCILINQEDKYGRTAIHLAALGLDLEIAEILIAKGAIVNAQDEDGETPLHLAESAAMTELLLKEGKANPNIPNVDGICALHLAVQRLDIDSVRVLVLNNANVNNADNIRWLTALHLIALPTMKEGGGNPDEDARCRIAQLLTGEYGPNTPDVNYQDIEGNTPLHYAVQLQTEDACDLIMLFLEKNANPNLRNMRDQVPFQLLCRNEKLRTCKKYQEIIHTLLLYSLRRLHHSSPMPLPQGH